MAKIPFDIKYRPQIESGEYKVETEEGSPARIICWDSPIDKERPIIAIVFDDQIEQYKADGHYDNDYETSNYDLFLITPEPELSEFEEKVRVCVTENLTTHIKDGNGREMSSTVFIDDDTAKAMAAELLELAKKELCESGEVTDWYAKGKAEALKDLPKWVKVDEGVLLDKHSNYLLYSNGVCYYCCGTTITRDGYMLLVDDLKKLPKEDEK